MRWVIAAVVLASCRAEPAPKNVVTLPTQSSSAPPVAMTIALPQAPPTARPDAPVHRWIPPMLKDPPDTTQARLHFSQGVQQFSAGNYAQAATEFEQAWAFSPRAQLLFNIAITYEKLGHPEIAIDVYTRYADTHPANETDVRARIDKLRPRSGP